MIESLVKDLETKAAQAFNMASDLSELLSILFDGKAVIEPDVLSARIKHALASFEELKTAFLL